jgi:hypothetical protein
MNAGRVGAGAVNKCLKHGWADIDGVDLDGGVLAEQASSEATIAVSQRESVARGAAFIQVGASAKHEPGTKANQLHPEIEPS